MTADRRQGGGSRSEVVISRGIIAETVGCRGDTAAVGTLGGISQQCVQGVYAFEHIAVRCRILCLPCGGLCLTHGGIAVIGKSTSGIGRSIVALTGVGDVGTQTCLQLQLWDDRPLSETGTDETGVLRFRLGVL